MERMRYLVSIVKLNKYPESESESESTLLKPPSKFKWYRKFRCAKNNDIEKKFATIVDCISKSVLQANYSSCCITSHMLTIIIEGAHHCKHFSGEYGVILWKSWILRNIPTRSQFLKIYVFSHTKMYPYCSHIAHGYHQNAFQGSPYFSLISQEWQSWKAKLGHINVP